MLIPASSLFHPAPYIFLQASLQFALFFFLLIIYSFLLLPYVFPASLPPCFLPFCLFLLLPSSFLRLPSIKFCLLFLASFSRIFYFLPLPLFPTSSLLPPGSVLPSPDTQHSNTLMQLPKAPNRLHSSTVYSTL